ncbi:SGNH/GDSL hydrolase family protein [Actinocatenispora rupis]|uniref:Lipase 1 n=1 Tax=Actinocatenispora rupis TaxID=519421 RepID=A0A8J3J466_9ACTN|nr:SGNH/GDSL hydrolase family protein [Actinocatenispora rupis]GID11311.1 lipase 1 [Actinocatenispora rupis]
MTVPRHAVRRAVRATSVAVAAVVATLLVGVGTAHAATPSYVALGDSYSSGVGTRSYIDDGTSCQRSTYAYPELAASRLGANLTFDACSGAKTADVLNNQLGHLTAGTSLVTISIGGNDAGFSNVITKCAYPWPYNCTNDINNAISFMQNTLPGRLDSVYSAIRSHAPNARVVVVGYPRLFNGQTCNALARISATEEGQLNHAADVLAGVISARASAHSFSFVDPRSAFSTHEICSSSEWLNGLSDPVSESYHPNRSGHVGYADLVTPALSAALSRS